MARDDLFRRSFEAGTAFLDMTRERAEALVKELVKQGEVRKGKAQKLIDEVLERSRKGTEDLRQLIRREIADQVAALGLATKDDIARLEARMTDIATPAPVDVTAPTPADPSPTSEPRPTKAPPVKRAGATKAAPKAAPNSAKVAANPTKAAKKAAPPPDAGGEPPVQVQGEPGGPPPTG